MTESLRPHAQPDADTQPFWDAVAEGTLRLQQCAACGRHVFYPRSVCPHCSSDELHWVDASGRGTIYAFSVVHRAPPGFDPPYIVALVDLDEGVRMMTRLLDVEPDEAAIGLEVEVEICGDPPLPYFKLARARRTNSAS